MDTTIYKNILYQIRTTSELDTLSQCIDAILRDVYYLSHESLTSMLTSRLRPEIYQALVTTLKDHSISIKEQETFKLFFTNLRPLLMASPVLTITVSYTLGDSSITALSAKAKELFGETTVLEVNVQKSIAAGAVIIYKGKYIDLSLTHRLDEVFKEHREELRQMLNPPKGVS